MKYRMLIFKIIILLIGTFAMVWSMKVIEGWSVLCYVGAVIVCVFQEEG